MKPKPPPRLLWSCPICGKPALVPGARCKECRRKGNWFAALAVCALAGAQAPAVARADSHDDIFWQFLQQHGLASAFTSETEAIATARAACTMLARTGDVIGVDSLVANQTGLSGYNAGVFVGAGAAAYCPKTWQSLQPQ
jgi:predicted RNA-binding Zn-ribbon protein involved in translation (DUF1610 family)